MYVIYWCDVGRDRACHLVRRSKIPGRTCSAMIPEMGSPSESMWMIPTWDNFNLAS